MFPKQKAGQIVKVKVMEIDILRKRIALTMRLQETKSERQGRGSNSTKGAVSRPKKTGNSHSKRQSGSQAVANNAMAAKLAAALKK